MWRAGVTHFAYFPFQKNIYIWRDEHQLDYTDHWRFV